MKVTSTVMKIRMVQMPLFSNNTSSEMVSTISVQYVKWEIDVNIKINEKF